MRGSVVAFAIAGCTPPIQTTAPPPRPAARPAASVLAIPGESMIYQVRFRGLAVARVQVAIGRAGWVDGHRAVVVRAHGASDGVVAMLAEITWDLTTTLDLDGGYPRSHVEEASVLFQGKREHERRTRTWEPGDTKHDALSAAAWLRAWPARPDDRGELAVEIAGADFTVELWRAGREMVEAPKPMAAVRYDGRIEEDFHFAAWISDDAARVPLRLRTETKWGDVTGELLEYDAPE